MSNICSYLPQNTIESVCDSLGEQIEKTSKYIDFTKNKNFQILLKQNLEVHK